MNILKYLRLILRMLDICDSDSDSDSDSDNHTCPIFDVSGTKTVFNV